MYYLFFSLQVSKCEGLDGTEFDIPITLASNFSQSVSHDL